MTAPAVLYDLGTIVRDDLVGHSEEIADALGRDEYAVENALQASAPRYIRGEISQGAHWEDAIARLDSEDFDTLATYAQHYADIDIELLGWIRGQQTWKTGLVSDATPDFVGHFRRELKLDRLFRVHVIESETAGAEDYAALLKTAAGRLQTEPRNVWFIDRKPAHLDAAASIGMRTIDLKASPDYASAFRVIV